MISVLWELLEAVLMMMLMSVVLLGVMLKELVSAITDLCVATYKGVEKVIRKIGVTKARKARVKARVRGSR